jgi:hypothetical protein
VLTIPQAAEENPRIAKENGFAKSSKLRFRRWLQLSNRLNSPQIYFFVASVMVKSSHL